MLYEVITSARKPAGIEEIGADAPRFELEFTEFQDLAAAGQFDEFGPVIAHNSVWHPESDFPKPDIGL